MTKDVMLDKGEISFATGWPFLLQMNPNTRRWDDQSARPPSLPGILRAKRWFISMLLGRSTSCWLELLMRASKRASSHVVIVAKNCAYSGHDYRVVCVVFDV